MNKYEAFSRCQNIVSIFGNNDGVELDDGAYMCRVYGRIVRNCGDCGLRHAMILENTNVKKHTIQAILEGFEV